MYKIKYMVVNMTRTRAALREKSFEIQKISELEQESFKYPKKSLSKQSEGNLDSEW